MLESEGGSFEESQIAFFGGSFTAIEKTRMEALLSVANEYINKGVAQSIRISTRPDCINEEILEILKKYRVTHIELGVQSTDERVLSACKRGHNADDSFNAARLIVNQGFVFGGQMMIGLPEATAESEIQTALDIVKMSAGEARIYPTVVFEETELYEMTKNGTYNPLGLEEAIERTAKCYRIFHDAGGKNASNRASFLREFKKCTLRCESPRDRRAGKKPCIYRYYRRARGRLQKQNTLCRNTQKRYFDASRP